MISHVYIEKMLPLTLPKSRRNVRALTYVVDPKHIQYGGHLSRAEKLALIRQGHGEAGSCIDYVRNTSQHLHDLGIPDPELDSVIAQL